LERRTQPMNKLIIHAENFTVFKEKQSWEIGRYNFLFGESSSGKSSLINLLELFPINHQEMKEVKNFQSFGPYANFQNILHDSSKPLKIGFEIHSPFGIVNQSYLFKADSINTQAVLSDFKIEFNEELVFHYENEDGQLFTLPTINLFEATRNYIASIDKTKPLPADCPMHSELLSPIFRLADDTSCIGEVEREFFTRTPTLLMKKKQPQTDAESSWVDYFFQLFEITDFNGLDDFAESLSWFVRQSFSNMGSYFNRNILNTMRPFNHFVPADFRLIELRYKKFEEVPLFSNQVRISQLFKDFGLPEIIRSDIIDNEKNIYGYSYLFQYRNNKKVQFYQLSSMERKMILLITQILSHELHHREFVYHNDPGWMYLDNIESYVPANDITRFIKKITKHFPHYIFFFETRNSQFQNLIKQLIIEKGAKKSQVRIYHFIKNQRSSSSKVNRHWVTKKNEIFPTLSTNTNILVNWKKIIQQEVHFN
jgi:hypothetical protein